jgi:hypothetical protein
MRYYEWAMFSNYGHQNVSVSATLQKELLVMSRHPEETRFKTILK